MNTQDRSQLAGNISLVSGTLRGSAIELMGSGFGSLSPDNPQHYSQVILPEMFQLAASCNLKIELVADTIQKIEHLWDQNIAPGKRLVISIN